MKIDKQIKLTFFPKGFNVCWRFEAENIISEFNTANTLDDFFHENGFFEAIKLRHVIENTANILLQNDISVAFLTVSVKISDRMAKAIIQYNGG